MEAELMYWLPPSRVKQSGKATTTGGMRCSPISRSRRSGRFSWKPAQFVWDKPLTRQADKIHQQGQSVFLVASWDVNIDDAHRRIPQHIALEGLALIS